MKTCILISCFADVSTKKDPSNPMSPLKFKKRNTISKGYKQCYFLQIYTLTLCQQCTMFIFISLLAERKLLLK